MKVLFINGHGHSESHDMECAPRIGDTIPLFYKPYPKVTGVMWLPEKVDPAMKGFDCVITVE
jgi:hypothetical protein